MFRVLGRTDHGFIVRVPTTLSEVIETMSPLQVQFIEALDKELTKVQNFYREREKEALLRSAVIKEQLNELKDHRKIFHVRIFYFLVPSVFFLTLAAVAGLRGTTP